MIHGKCDTKRKNKYEIYQNIGKKLMHVKEEIQSLRYMTENYVDIKVFVVGRL